MTPIIPEAQADADLLVRLYEDIMAQSPELAQQLKAIEKALAEAQLEPEG